MELMHLLLLDLSEKKEQSKVKLFDLIGNWILANPLWTILILLGIAALALLLFKYFKSESINDIKDEAAASKLQNKEDSSISIGNTHHIGARESQQDSFGISDISNRALCAEKGIFAVVADGMGGLSRGGEVSSFVVSTMLKYFNQKVFSSTLENELFTMVSTANEKVNQFLGMDGRGKSGSTVVSVILKDNKLYWIAVGDSRICLIRNGAVIQINQEHNYGSELDEKAAKGEISYEEAENNPQRAALTNFLGMGVIEKIDRNIRPLQLIEGDRVLLMTDGIFGTLSQEEILSVMDTPPYESAARIEKMILQKNKPKQDNFTAVILECM